MAPPFIPWPGADGLLTANMWAWRFPTRPPFLGPPPLSEPVYVEPPSPCKMEEEPSEMAGSQVRLVRILGQDFIGPPPPSEPVYVGPPLPCDMEEEPFEMAGSQVRLVRILGQDFSAKSTPPPCSMGYIPVNDRGVIRCIPGSLGGFPNGATMTTQRTYPVSAFYGFENG